jgi:tRNA nucleotidyltransferase/poly(A) polymerase
MTQTKTNSHAAYTMHLQVDDSATMSHDRAVGTSVALQLQKAGFIAVFAGGCVRDRLLGRIPKDFDVATNATPEQILAIFNGDEKSSGDTVLTVGVAFGVIIVIREGVQIEVATLRTDGQYADGRRPDAVTFVTSADADVALRADAARRDLTINAMFEDPATGCIYDFFGGWYDLKRRELKTVGDAADRFGEDRLRMLRVVRFAGKLGFSVAPSLMAALKTHAHDLKPGAVVSWERVAAELEGMLTSAHPTKAMELLMETGLMSQILPEMMQTLDPQLARQDFIWHPEGLVWQHTLLVLQELVVQGASFELLLAGLLHDIAKPQTMKIEWELDQERISNYGHAEKGAVIAADICRRLKLSARQVHRVSEIVRLHMQMHAFNDPAIKRSKLVRLLERDDIMDLIMMQHADCLGTGRSYTERLEASLTDFYLGKLEEMANDPTPSRRAGAACLVDGLMIKRLGIKPGPAYRVIKDAAYDAQHAGEFTDVEGAEKWLEANAVALAEAPLPVAGEEGAEDIPGGISGRHCC